MAEKIATMVYKCIGCENEIRRPIHKDEVILLGKTKCMKCGEWILFFKLDVQDIVEINDIAFLYSNLKDLMRGWYLKDSLCDEVDKIGKKYNLKEIKYDKEAKDNGRMS